MALAYVYRGQVESAPPVYSDPVLFVTRYFHLASFELEQVEVLGMTPLAEQPNEMFHVRVRNRLYRNDEVFELAVIRAKNGRWFVAADRLEERVRAWTAYYQGEDGWMNRFPSDLLPEPSDVPTPSPSDELDFSKP